VSHYTEENKVSLAKDVKNTLHLFFINTKGSLINIQGIVIAQGSWISIILVYILSRNDRQVRILDRGLNNII